MKEMTADVRTVVELMCLAPWTHVVIKRKKPTYALGGGLVDSVKRRFGSFTVDECMVTENCLIIYVKVEQFFIDDTVKAGIFFLFLGCFYTLTYSCDFSMC